MYTAIVAWIMYNIAANQEACVYRFEPSAPLDFTPYPEPDPADRSGPPLSQGFLLTMINTVAADHCSPELCDQLMQVDPEAWYHGQLFETILNDFESKEAGLPAEIGKNIYYMMRSEFTAQGLQTPTDVIKTIPYVWLHVTRGDSGKWRTEITGPRQARIEMEQPYNCRFESGAVQGALEAFDALAVEIEHLECMREGSPCCILEARWQE